MYCLRHQLVYTRQGIYFVKQSLAGKCAKDVRNLYLKGSLYMPKYDLNLSASCLDCFYKSVVDISHINFLSILCVQPGFIGSRPKLP